MNTRTTYISIGFFYDKVLDKYWTLNKGLLPTLDNALILRENEVAKEKSSKDWRSYLEIPESYEFIYDDIPLVISPKKILKNFKENS